MSKAKSNLVAKDVVKRTEKKQVYGQKVTLTDTFDFAAQLHVHVEKRSSDPFIHMQAHPFKYTDAEKVKEAKAEMKKLRKPAR